MPHGAPWSRPVHRARRVSEPHTVPQVAAPVAPVRRAAALTGNLTRFQVAIVRLVAEGYTDAKIAAELGLTEGTVSTEIRRARTRLDAANRAHLAAIAIRRRII